MSVKAIQYFLASVFFILGGWARVWPSSVIALGVTPAYQTDAPLAVFAVGCFGAQAMISGLFAAFTNFTRTTFLVYGIALLPFFVFNYWFFAVVPIFTVVALLDAVGNVVMLVLCVLGWRAAARSEMQAA